jgi:hypothetical protein
MDLKTNEERSGTYKPGKSTRGAFLNVCEESVDLQLNPVIPTSVNDFVDVKICIKSTYSVDGEEQESRVRRRG